MSWFETLVNPLLGNVIGGTAAQAVTIGSLFLLTLLVFVLLIARIPFEFALIIVSPAIIVASFSGLIPPLAFGIVVLLIAFFFVGVIAALAR